MLIFAIHLEIRCTNEPAELCQLSQVICSLSPRDKKWPFPFWDPDWRDRHTKECRWWNTTASEPILPLWQLLARKPEQALNYVTLRLPESKGEYPAEWGHEPFPAKRGKFSERFQEWLTQDVAARWPDVDAPEDPGL